MVPSVGEFVGRTNGCYRWSCQRWQGQQKLGNATPGAAMSTDPTLTPQIIGQAEKTMNAILFRLLAGPGLTEAQWITLTLTAAGGGATARGRLVAEVAHALKISQAQAQEHLDSLVAAHLVQEPGDDAGPVRFT